MFGMASMLLSLPGQRYDCLEPGLHWLGFADLRDLFGFNSHRLLLLNGLVRACSTLRAAGCGRVYLGGSLVTSKEVPSDYDGVWDPAGVISSMLDPIFYDTKLIEEQRRLFFGELHVGGVDSEMFNYFSKDKFTEKERGMVGIRLNLAEIHNYDN
jgi:hypothetical protein